MLASHVIDAQVIQGVCHAM